MSPSSSEVRRCAHCGQPAAVCIRDWQRTQFGVRTGGSSTRDFCCQACGHRFTLVSIVAIGSQIFVALLLAIAIVPFFLFGGWALYRAWPWIRNPVVPGAPMPVVRFQDSEPTRACTACGGPAACRSATRRSANFIPTGTEYRYACARCGASFMMSNAVGVAFELFGGTFLLFLGVLTLLAGIGVLFLLGALFMYAMAAWNVIKYVRHPVLAEHR